MSKRDYIPLKVQLAAMLLTVRVEEDGKLVPFIDHETAKQLTPDQIISLFHRDHSPIRKENGGPDAHWNLVFLPIMEHRIKTAKIDRPASAKSKRIAEKQEAFRRRLLTKIGQKVRQVAEKKGRPIPGSKRSGWRHRMDGRWERRET